jgi:hypothetical protein
MTRREHREEPRWKDFKFNQPYAKALTVISLPPIRIYTTTLYRT